VKYKLLIYITILCFFVFVFTFWKGLGRWTANSPARASKWSNDPLNDPAYKVREDFIIRLMSVSGKRPYTDDEMKMLRKLLELKEGDCLWRDHYGDAIYLLSLSPDPKQRKEAIQPAIRGLNDPCWYIRALSVKALVRLKGKEATSLIVPLLNDSQAEVRSEVKKALKKLGYQISHDYE